MLNPRMEAALTSVVGARGYRCSRCERVFPVEIERWHCDCGGVLDLEVSPPPVLPGHRLRGRAASLWRYHEVIPIAAGPTVSLGEGFTPLVTTAGLPGVRAKADYLMPSGSYKDRGAVVLAALASELGATKAVVDSSGNAGAAVAAYFARVGVGCEVVVPFAALLHRGAPDVLLA